MRTVLLAMALLAACNTNEGPPGPRPLALKGPVKVGSDVPGSLGTWESLSLRLFQICPGFEITNPTRPREDPLGNICYASFQGVDLRFVAEAARQEGTEAWAVSKLGVAGDVPCSAVYGAYRELLALAFTSEDTTAIIDALSRSLPKAEFTFQGYVFGVHEIGDKSGVTCGFGIHAPLGAATRAGATATPTAPGR